MEEIKEEADDEEMKELIAKCWDEDPAERPEMKDVVKILQQEVKLLEAK